jgi:hypothetical protein
MHLSLVKLCKFQLSNASKLSKFKILTQPPQPQNPQPPALNSKPPTSLFFLWTDLWTSRSHAVNIVTLCAWVQVRVSDVEVDMEPLSFGDWGRWVVECKPWVAECRVQGVGCWVCGLRCRVEGRDLIWANDLALAF